MDKFFIRRCLNGKSYVASASPDFTGLGNKKCPYTNEAFETQVKEVNPEKSEIMGIAFEETAAGVAKDGLFFGKFRINLGETMIMD